MNCFGPKSVSQLCKCSHLNFWLCIKSWLSSRETYSNYLETYKPDTDWWIYTGEYKFPLDKRRTCRINSGQHLLSVSKYMRKWITDLSCMYSTKRELGCSENYFFHIVEKGEKLSLTNNKTILYKVQYLYNSYIESEICWINSAQNLLTNFFWLHEDHFSSNSMNTTFFFLYTEYN